MSRLQAIAVVVFWLGAMLPAIWAIEAYQATPGRTGQPVVREVAHSARPRLLVFLHPKCPCSAATLSELAEIVVEHRAALDAEVIFVRPAETAAGWEQTSLWDAAAALPSVQVRSDSGGVLAKQFGAATSGHAVLYGAGGQLLFSGGITPARGVAGDNLGRRAIDAALNGQSADNKSAPVFGCPLTRE
jgi:hypothetical protein